MGEVTTLLAFAALAWFWSDSLKARERALAAGQLACARHGLQFLDEKIGRAHV